MFQTPDLLCVARLPNALGQPLDIALSAGGRRNMAYLEAVHRVHGDRMWQKDADLKLTRVLKSGDATMARWMREHGARFAGETDDWFPELGRLMMDLNQNDHVDAFAYLVEAFPLTRGHVLSMAPGTPDVFEWRLRQGLIPKQMEGLHEVLGVLAGRGDYARVDELWALMEVQGWHPNALGLLQWEILAHLCQTQSMIGILDMFANGPMPDLSPNPIPGVFSDNPDNLFDAYAPMTQTAHSHPFERDLLSVFMDRFGVAEALDVFGVHPDLVTEYQRRLTDGVPVMLDEMFLSKHTRHPDDLRRVLEAVFDTHRLIDLSTSTPESPWASGMVSSIAQARPEMTETLAGWVCDRHPILLAEQIATMDMTLGGFFSTLLTQGNTSDPPNPTLASRVENCLLELNAAPASRPTGPGRRL